MTVYHTSLESNLEPVSITLLLPLSAERGTSEIPISLISTVVSTLFQYHRHSRHLNPRAWECICGLHCHLPCACSDGLHWVEVIFFLTGNGKAYWPRTLKVNYFMWVLALPLADGDISQALTLHSTCRSGAVMALPHETYMSWVLYSLLGQLNSYLLGLWLLIS